jgi:MFS family permease
MAFSSLVGVLAGGYLSDRWIQTHIRGRIFVSTIGLGLTIPALFLLGFGTEVWHLVGAAICFGLGYGMFDANNMPILCQIVSEKQRYCLRTYEYVWGIAGALIILGKSTDQGNLGYFSEFGRLSFYRLRDFLALIKPKIAK